jgi:predicted nucleotidyltransferase
MNIQKRLFRQLPKLSVSVVSLAGLAILKLVSWDDNSARRQKDASDLVFIVRNYLDAGNLERLLEEAPDIVDSSDYDYEAGSARLLAGIFQKLRIPALLISLSKF